jgi:hypothetical protein
LIVKSSFTPSFAAKICVACVGGPLIALGLGAPTALAAPSAGTSHPQKQASSSDNPGASVKPAAKRLSPTSGKRAFAEPEVPDFAMSFNGHSLIQSGSATATSDPGFNLAVAGAGSNAYAGGGGLFNLAVADHNSTARATGGVLNVASADDNSTAIAEDGTFTVAQAKNNSTATISGGKLNIADATNGSTATVSGGDRNTATSDGNGSVAFAGNGTNNTATASCGTHADASGADNLVVTTPIGGCQ